MYKPTDASVEGEQVREKNVGNRRMEGVQKEWEGKREREIETSLVAFKKPR